LLIPVVSSEATLTDYTVAGNVKARWRALSAIRPGYQGFKENRHQQKRPPTGSRY